MFFFFFFYIKNNRGTVEGSLYFLFIGYHTTVWRYCFNKFIINWYTSSNSLTKEMQESLVHPSLYLLFTDYLTVSDLYSCCLYLLGANPVI